MWVVRTQTSPLSILQKVNYWQTLFTIWKHLSPFKILRTDCSIVWHWGNLWKRVKFGLELVMVFWCCLLKPLYPPIIYNTNAKFGKKTKHCYLRLKLHKQLQSLKIQVTVNFHPVQIWPFPPWWGGGLTLPATPWLFRPRAGRGCQSLSPVPLSRGVRCTWMAHLGLNSISYWWS